MKKLDNKEPVHKGKHYVDEVQNSYSGSIPNVIKESFNLRLYLAWIGSAFMLQRSEWKRVIKTYTLKEADIKEQEDLAKERYRSNQGLKDNFVADATNSNAKKVELLSYLGLIGEYLVFQNIGENLFNITYIASLFFGLVIFVPTEVVKVLLKPYIIDWIRSNNVTLTSTAKRILIGFTSLLTFFLCIAGLANYYDKYYVKLEDKESKTITKIASYKEEGLDTSLLESNLAVIKEKLKGKDGSFFTFLKLLSYAMIGFLCMLGSAICSIYAQSQREVVQNKKELEENEKKLNSLRSRIKQLNTIHPNVQRLQEQIIQCFGQKELLEKLMTPEQCKALQID